MKFFWILSLAFASIVGCEQRPTFDTSKVLDCMLNSQSAHGDNDVLVIETPVGECASTSEAYYYYQFCEVVLNLVPDESCENLPNAADLGVPENLKAATKARKALVPQYREHCGMEPVSTRAILTEIKKCQS
ncbi:MAG: hypothetical protein AAFZ91_14755 [Pseudomonadota bacterium]